MSAWRGTDGLPTSVKGLHRSGGCALCGACKNWSIIMRTPTLLALAALLAPLALSAPAAANEVQPEQKMICKYRMQTGTRFKTKTCKTAAEWEEIAEANRNALKEAVDRPQIKVCGPNGCD